MTFGSNEEAAGWLAGFFDGEGTVNAVLQTRRLSVCYHVREQPVKPGRRRAWNVTVYGRENFARFDLLVPFRHPEKRRRLKWLIASYEVTRRKRVQKPCPLSVEQLRHFYCVLGLSSSEIEEATGVPRRTVSRHVAKAGLSRTYREAERNRLEGLSVE